MLQKSPNEIRKLVLNQIKIGRAIRSQRIDYVEDLEEARAEKQEWVSRTTELLKQLFADATVIEQCNDWVGPILPEYAEWEMFVELFDKEMKHRIGRLQELINQLDPPQAPPLASPVPTPHAPPPGPSRADAAALPVPPVLLRMPKDPQARRPSRISCARCSAPSNPSRRPFYVRTGLIQGCHNQVIRRRDEYVKRPINGGMYHKDTLNAEACVDFFRSDRGG